MDTTERTVWTESAGTKDKEMLRQYHQKRRRIRIVLFVIAAVLPIVMISFLVTHLDMINMWRSQWMDGSGTGSSQEPSSLIIGSAVDEDEFTSDGDPMIACVPIIFKTSDGLDTEEREILQGIKTSFLPPQSVVYPPECLGGDVSEVTAVAREEFVPQDTISMLLNFFLRRPRREIPEASSLESISGDDNNTQLTTDDMTTISRGMSMTTTIDGITTTTPRNLPIETSEEPVQNLSLSSFWTEENSDFDSVREVQAAIMKRYMDPTADPCEDFYQYACGNWEALNPIPKDRAAYDTFEILRESLDQVLRGLLENENTT